MSKNLKSFYWWDL